MLRISWLFCIFRYSPANKVWKPKRGKFPNQDMAKVQNISEIHPTFRATAPKFLLKYVLWHKSLKYFKKSCVIGE